MAVSIHAPARGATGSSTVSERRRAVSIHAPARGATCSAILSLPDGTFQFTRPRGARLRLRFDARMSDPVSIHAPARGATTPTAKSPSPKSFQFTRPRGARLDHVGRFRSVGVSIHAPARGATRRCWTPARRSRFNSRAREGRDLEGGDAEPRQGVSIHAPARGATAARVEAPHAPAVSIHAPARGATAHPQVARPRERVSIHAPARGATRDGWVLSMTCQRFQFTRPRGARRGRVVHGGRRPLVSIHAPARGATAFRNGPRRTCDVSIHAPARGATIRTDQAFPPAWFQFTRPRGARRRRHCCAAWGSRCFNSRAREGRDRSGPCRSGLRRVSIHAPARGATTTPTARESCWPFQFTRPRGARPRPRSGAATRWRFNSRAREGRDVAEAGRVEIGIVSIHAPARGATVRLPRVA